MSQEFRASLALALACTALPAAASQPLHVGAASVKITPPLGSPLAGYYHGRGAQAVHDDLYAKAIVLSHGGVKAALVSLDLIKAPGQLVERAHNESSSRPVSRAVT